MNWSNIALQIIEILSPVIYLLLAAILGFVVNWIRKKIEELDDNIFTQTVFTALNEIEKVTRDAIMYTNQVLIDELKEHTKEGTLTREQAEMAMETAINYFKTHITENSLAIGIGSLGPLQDWLEDYIEAKLGEMKYGEKITDIKEISAPK